MIDATIVDVEGRWILHWPDGQRTVPAARELLVQITDDHNAQKAEIDQLRADNARLSAAATELQEQVWEYQHRIDEMEEYVLWPPSRSLTAIPDEPVWLPEEDPS